MKLSEHFTLEEFSHSENAIEHGIDNTPPAEAIAKLKILCEKVLEPVREYHGAVSIRSGYRCKALNELVGGSKTSGHMKGDSSDIEAEGTNNYDLAVWIRNHLEFDQLILENYKIGDPSSGWVHVSYREKNRNQVMTYADGQYISGLNK